MKIVCTKDPEHDRFHVTAHVAEEWLTDETGAFVEEVDGPSDIVHQPDAHDLWTCACGATAVATP